MDRLGAAAWAAGLCIYIGWLAYALISHERRVTTIASRVEGDCSAPRGMNEQVDLRMYLNRETGKLEVICERTLHRP